MNIFWTGFMPPIIREIGSAIFGTNFQNFASIANKVVKYTGAEIPAISATNTQGLGFPYFRNKKGNLEVWVLSDG
jgi:hypothetical protein